MATQALIFVIETVINLFVLAVLTRIGWTVKRQSGSHRTLARTDWPDVVFAFHDDEELGPRMLSRSREDVYPRLGTRTAARRGRQQSDPPADRQHVPD